MNTNPELSEKDFDAEINKLIHSQKPEKAPAFFTEKVMNRVRQEKTVIKYHPVISKGAWYTIVIFVLAVAGFALTAPASSSNTRFTMPQFFSPLLLESFNHWFDTVAARGWQMIYSSGLLLPFAALFFALGLHFFIINSFNNSRKSKLDKMVCF